VDQALKERVALVTGGARGIGRAVSLELAGQGAHVVANFARSSGPAEELVSEIRQSGGSAEALQFDVSDSSQVSDAISGIAKAHGRLDILVNNAGIAIDSLLMRSKDEDWDKIVGTNLSGALYCARAAAKPMMKGRWGRIINLSSVIGQMGNAGQSMYSATKAGLLGLTKSLAKELASRSITVNAITPGYIQTDMTAELDDDLREQIANQIPLGRLGTAEDVASAAGFLCSDGGGYITGQVIGVNGGMYM